jgi:hypothetical protein
MTELDDIAKLLEAASETPCPISFWSEAYNEPTLYGKLFADAILAAGYRKSPNEEDVERAAKAVYSLDGRAGAWETRHEEIRGLYREDARAVIAALTGR